MSAHPHFYIQGDDDGRPGEPRMKYGPSLVVCEACDWGQWSAKDGEEPGGRHAAGEAHIAAAHPAYPVYEPPKEIVGSAELIEALQREVESLRGLVGAMTEALVPQCCHVTGEHDPSHFVEGRHLCGFQKTEAWHRAVLLLGLDHHNNPEAAKGRPDTCCHCRSKEVAA